MSSRRMVNSSPPRRATVSPGRTQVSSRRAIAVSRRSPFRWLLEPLAVGDVGLRAGDADRLAGAGADADAAAEHPAVAAVLVQHPVLVLEMGGLAQDVGRQVGLQLLDVVGMDPLHPVLGRLADLVALVAEHGLPPRREVDLAAAQVPVPEAVLGALDGERVALLAGLERPLGVVEVRDVPEHALDAGHVAAGVVDRGLDHADVEEVLAGRMVLLDGLEGLPRLDDAPVVLLVLPGERGGEEVEVRAPEHLLEAPADRRAELGVGEGEAPLQVLADDVLGQVLDERVVERHRGTEGLLGLLVVADVAREAEGADDVAARVAVRHLGGEDPRLGLVGPAAVLLEVDDRLAGLDDLLLALVGGLGERAGEEVEVGLADRLRGVGEPEACGERAADAEEAAVAVLEVDEVLEGVEEDDELEMFLDRGFREARDGHGPFRPDRASRTHITVCHEDAIRSNPNPVVASPCL
jgi:hypothetical protein